MVSTKIAPIKAVTVRKKNIRSTVRKMGKIAASQTGNSRGVPVDTNEPIVLGRRLVLRPRIPVPVKLFVALHKLYKEDSMRATNMLSSTMYGGGVGPTCKFDVALRCAIHELWEDRLKTTAQLLGFFPPDPELSRPTQELFEQFWKAHGYPNDAEIELLEQVGYVDAAAVDAWFLLKDCRLRTYRLMQEVMRAFMVNTLLGQKDWRYIVKRGLKTKKPYSRH